MEAEEGGWLGIPLAVPVPLDVCPVSEYSIEEAGKLKSKILQHYSVFGLFYILVNCGWKLIER